MRAVDTNLLVRLIARDDVKQVAGVETFVERGAWVSHLALAEATWVLSAVDTLIDCRHYSSREVARPHSAGQVG